MPSWKRRLLLVQRVADKALNQVVSPLLCFSLLFYVLETCESEIIDIKNLNLKKRPRKLKVMIACILKFSIFPPLTATHLVAEAKLILPALPGSDIDSMLLHAQ